MNNLTKNMHVTNLFKTINKIICVCVCGVPCVERKRGGEILYGGRNGRWRFFLVREENKQEGGEKICLADIVLVEVDSGALNNIAQRLVL